MVMWVKHSGLLPGLAPLFILVAEIATIISVSADGAPQEPSPGAK